MKDSLSPDPQPPMDFADDEPETLALHYDQLTKVIKFSNIIFVILNFKNLVLTLDPGFAQTAAAIPQEWTRPSYVSF